jgi:hypothetical protein
MLTASHVAIAAAALTLCVSPLAAQTEAPAKADSAETASQTSPEAQADPITAAAATDFRAGLEVRDSNGGLVGTVESVDGQGAIVFTGNLRAKLPFQSFGKNNQGLVISLSRAELEAAASAKRPS